jgi:hypothetical protein
MSEVDLILGSTNFRVSEQALRLNTSLLIDHPGLQAYKVHTQVGAHAFQEFLRALETGSDISFTHSNFSELSMLCEEFGAARLKGTCDGLHHLAAGFAVDSRFNINEVHLEEREAVMASRLDALQNRYRSLETVCGGLRADITKLQDSMGDFQVFTEIEKLKSQMSAVTQSVSRWENTAVELRQLNNSLREECKTFAFSVPFIREKPGPGIFAELAERYGQNLEANGVVTFTSKSKGARFGFFKRWIWNQGSEFVSENAPNQWVCWDFRESRVRPTHYTLETSGLKSWVLEGSLDGVSWVEIDRARDTHCFQRHLSVRCTFAVPNPQEWRSLRLTQTSKDHNGQDTLRFSRLEFFGSFAAPLDPMLAQVQKQSRSLMADCGGLKGEVATLMERTGKVASTIAEVKRSVASLETETRRCVLSLPMKGPKSCDGIIAHLTKEHGGNVDEKGIVSVTAKSLFADPQYSLKAVTNLRSESPVFWSTDAPGQWVCWDFHNLSICPTHYTIRSHLVTSWVIEGSLDGENWTEIDRQRNIEDFKECNTASFAVSHPGKYRLIRLTQPDKNHRGDDLLGLGPVEFFGTLFE